VIAIALQATDRIQVDDKERVTPGGTYLTAGGKASILIFLAYDFWKIH
jgi:hypothetical protein